MSALNSNHIDVRHHFFEEANSRVEFVITHGGSAGRRTHEATQQCGFLPPPGFSDGYMMHVRDRTFCTWGLVGGIILSIFIVENSGDDAVFTWLFPRKLSFFLGIDFESLMLGLQ